MVVTGLNRTLCPAGAYLRANETLEVGWLGFPKANEASGLCVLDTAADLIVPGHKRLYTALQSQVSRYCLLLCTAVYWMGSDVFRYEESNSAHKNMYDCLVDILKSTVKHILTPVFDHFLSRIQKTLKFKQLFVITLFSLYYYSRLLMVSESWMFCWWILSILQKRPKQASVDTW